MTFTADLYTPKVSGALEAWLDACSALTPADLGAFADGMAGSGVLVERAGVPEVTRCYWRLVDLVRAMQDATAAVRREVSRNG